LEKYIEAAGETLDDLTESFKQKVQTWLPSLIVWCKIFWRYITLIISHITRYTKVIVFRRFYTTLSGMEVRFVLYDDLGISRYLRDDISAIFFSLCTLSCNNSTNSAHYMQTAAQEFSR
jgi:hypothetical protein